MPSILDTVRATLKKPAATTAQLTATLDQVRKAESEAHAAVEAAGAKFEAGVLDDDATRQKKRAALFEARTNADDATALRAEAQRRHAAALAADEEARRKLLYQAGTEASGVAAEAIARQYPRLCREMLGLLGQLACAQRTVVMANAELPAGAEPIADPEHVARGNPGLPREIVSDEEVKLWGRVDLQTPMEAEFQGRIYDCGNGWGRAKPLGLEDSGTLSMGEPTANYRLRWFRRVTYREAEDGQHPLPLAAALQLPALRGDRMLWGESFPVGYNPSLSRAVMGAAEPDRVIADLAQIEADAVARPVKTERPLKVEWAGFRDVVPLPEPEPYERVSQPLGPRPGKFGASPFGTPGRAAGGRR